ncbi:phospho-acceptor domain-containing protein [Pseudoduganella flava]|uniref:histidine kinase n=1 Tax=Pseudoduganella flava TaxID=871742 RepID=A0A562PI55_9BURK|nr:hybrid sensor histidine kinase/response regulator [Pseudoduganella flava]QGZ42802.1 response regulator [Pseudoduganella flava]TWI44097.1 phospho-acceptor domain-containing protein [Pseudoduganella flava]
MHDGEQRAYPPPHPAALTRETRDLMGLLALPALWAGRDEEAVLRIMSEAVEHLVPLAFLYADVGMRGGPRLRIQGAPVDLADAPAWLDSVTIWPRAAAQRVQLCDTPLGPQRVIVLSLGLYETAGGIWFGSPDPTFPTTAQVALLRAATTLAASGLQTARLNADREEASRAKDEFLAMLGHELRNPLAPIGGAADLLRYGRLDAAQIRRTSEIIARQVVHMTGLVNDLLDVSRVKRGLVTIERTRLDLNRVVADAVEQARPLVSNRRHHLALRLPPRRVAVEGDHKRLVQVLANLLSNAAKYTPEGGQITVEALCTDGHVEISVADNGIGIEAKLLPAVFDLFTQARRTPDRSQGGLGLGLALVKALVEQHQGTVSAHSDGPGRGSRFVVRLPALPADAAAPQGPLADLPGTAGKVRTLVVDDNVDAALMLALLLESQGHDVRTAHDGPAALALAEREPFDVGLLDIGLPGMDGRELARRLRQLPTAAAALLIAITGYGQDSDRRASLAAGFDHHFVKPVDTHALTALLAGARRR